jgi:hypothetical protein
MFWKKKETQLETTSWLDRLSGGLAQSSRKLTQGVVDAVTKRLLDQAALD